MKLYTGKGDQGKTGILGNERISKDHTRIEAYGTIDELNATIGILAHHCDQNLLVNLRIIQATLFEIGTELASTDPKPSINSEDISQLENWIDSATEKTEALTSFVLPGGTLGSSWFHMARTVCRRAERRIVTFQTDHQMNEFILIYVNRLSDLFFAWGRMENNTNGVPDIIWQPRK